MIIQPSPVRSDDKIKYRFKDEQILAYTNQSEIMLFDLSNIEKDKQYETQYPISKVIRNKDDELEVTLVKYHGANASHKARFPVLYLASEKDIYVGLEPIQLEELVIEEPERQPTAEQRLEALEATMIETLGGV